MARRPNHRVARPNPVAVVAVSTAALLGGLLLVALMVLLAGTGGAKATTVGTICHADGTAADIPAQYQPIYRAAAAEYKLGTRGPAILAAIHRHETGFGQNLGPSSAGAIGHMQFMPATWAAYGTDANDDGRANPSDPEDAIHSAARYLAATGAPDNWNRAIYAYNHADWYVRLILDTADGYQDLCEQEIAIPADLGDLPADPVERIVHVATWIDQQRIPYCWGGGHAPSPGPSTGTYCWTSTGFKAFGTSEKGLDCSGAVRWLLVLAGYPDPGPITSGSFAAVYPRGMGRDVTIWSNAAHVFIHVRGRGYWGTTSTNYRHGPGWIDAYPTADFTPSHAPRL